jgi:ferritin-like metal-binding protein YciE
MELDNLRALYIDELKDLYSAEKQLVKALPKMAKKATNPQLKQAFTNHLAETEGHVQRLEEIFQSLEAGPGGKKCVGMEGLIEEAKELIDEDPEEDVLDAGLISKAQHVEHYEMAGYGTVRTYAEILRETDHAELLQQTLDEEGNADKLLTQIAKSINTDAAIGDEESDESTATASGRRDREVSRTVERGESSRNTQSPTTKGRTGSRTRETSAR